MQYLYNATMSHNPVPLTDHKLRASGNLPENIIRAKESQVCSRCLSRCNTLDIGILMIRIKVEAIKKELWAIPR